jgi:hypothetical protein
MPIRHQKILTLTARSGSRLWNWINNDFLGLFREMRWSYLPPLMVYFAAGVSGFTGIIEAFFGTLRQMAALLAIAGMIALRGWMTRRPIPYLVVFLSVYGALMMIPFISMYYGLHEWTEARFGFGARTIAMVDTMADSPLGQVAMIPMLAWIAKEAPKNQKATYFAVMAAFTNLALSASQLGTKYLNNVFMIERSRYDELGVLMITVALITLILPIMTVVLLNPARTGKPGNPIKNLLNNYSS